MNRLLIIIFFAFNFSFGQTIQHEPRKLFVATLNVPQNTRNSNDAFTEFALKNNLKQLLCFRDGQISSDINFDKNGNVITIIENDNTIINKSEYQYDGKGRVIKTSHYSPNGNFKYGYEYEYLKDTKLTYENPGRILKNKDIFIKDKNQKISIDYGTDKEIVSKKIEIFNANGELKQKQEFSNGRLNREFIYYSKDGEKYEDKIFYPENREKIIETNKILDNDVIDKNGNTIINYSGDFKVSENKYNSANRLISSDFYSIKNGLWKKENYEYRNDTILINKSQDYILTGKNKSYQFIYNNVGFLEKVIKIDGTEKEIFEYKYQLNEK
ncbi:hypothetical protein [Lacinutrix sp. 5H-3-7-4]|uniref:hypothetical protein n=1 Tax=Lacinutrix sp. (strain 5H-3-7-4) TaxID=983544 RepID=UPI00020A3C4C|nr:hypothetical protein [Lacinutrix sp. 5H-3-7-4]AEH01616.1 hypothetical protein Lacal_1769 [Lacinutrix sp. 5H-3-7-4]